MAHYDQLRARFRRYGADGLHPKFRKARPGRPPQLDAVVERQVIALSLSWPSWGPQQLERQIEEEHGELVEDLAHWIKHDHPVEALSRMDCPDI